MADKEKTKIPLQNGCYIEVVNEEFYELKNRIIIQEDYNLIPCRIVKVSECWLVIPEKLVPKPIIEIKGGLK